MPSKVSAGALAAFSDGVYSANLPSFTPPPGYGLVPTLNSATVVKSGAATGMIANVYYNPDTNQAVIAFTGTDSGSLAYGAQLQADAQILNGDSNIKALDAAAQYVQTVQSMIQSDYPGADITLTGHSLGGSEALYALSQLDAGNALAGSQSQMTAVAFDALAMSTTTLGGGAAHIDGEDLASYADPAAGDTLAAGYTMPGGIQYIDTGTNPNVIIGFLRLGYFGLAGAAIGGIEAGLIAARGHSMDAMVAAIAAQDAASGSDLPVGQLKVDPSIAPLAMQIKNSSIANAALSLFDLWLLKHGGGDDSEAAQAMASELNGQDLTGGQFVGSPEGVAVQLADGTIYAVDSDGEISKLTSTTDRSGAATQILTRGDGSSTVSTSQPGANATTTVSSLDIDSAGQTVSSRVEIVDSTTGNQLSSSETDFSSTGAKLDTFTTDANGNVTSLDSFNADGSRLLSAYDSSGNVTRETQYATDGTSVASVASYSYDSRGNLAEIDSRDAAGNLLSADAYQPDGSHDLTTYGADGAQTVASYAASGALDMTQTFDVNGNLANETRYSTDGTTVASIASYSYDSTGRLAEIDTRDAAGNLASADVYQPDGSHDLTTYGADGAQTVASYAASGALDMTQTFDANGLLTSASGVSFLGVAWRETVDASGPHFTYGLQKVDYADVATKGAEALGSALGKALGGNSLVAQVGYGTVLGTLSKTLASELANGTLPTVSASAGDAFGGVLGGGLDGALNASFGTLGVATSQEFQGVGVNSIAALLMLELANSVGLKGFSAGLVESAGSTITSTMITNALGAVTTGGAGAADIGDAFFAALSKPQVLASVATSATGFFGSYLAAQLVQPTNADGAIGASVGSAVGSTIGSMFLGPLGAFIGSFIGDLLGDLIGDLFGGTPAAISRVEPDGKGGVNADFVLAKNGANPILVDDLATSTANAANELLEQAGALLVTPPAATTEFDQKNATVTVVQSNGVSATDPANSSGATWLSAIESASLAFLENAVLSDSDVVMLTALGAALARETSVGSISMDLTVARDYETYLASSDAIDAMIEANPGSSFATGWELTLLEAEGLGLTDVTPQTGATARLSNGIESIYDANGGLVEQIVFKTDGTQSIQKLPINRYVENGASSLRLAANTADAIIGTGDTLALSANDHVYLLATAYFNEDQIIFHKGDGQAVIESDSGGLIVFEADIPPTDLMFASDAEDDLIIRLRDAGDSLTFEENHEENSPAVETTPVSIELSDGSIVATYRAGGGTASVSAKRGGAVMIAGAGDDTFNLEYDSTDYRQKSVVYSSLDGNLTINAHVSSNYTLTNALYLFDLDANQVTFSRDQSNDLQIAVNATGKVITIGGEFNSQTHDGVQTILFADGAVWSEAAIQSAAASSVVSKTAPRLAQNIEGLNASVAPTSTLLTDDGGPALKLTPTQAQTDATPPSKIANAASLLETVDPTTAAVETETIVGSSVTPGLVGDAVAIASGSGSEGAISQAGDGDVHTAPGASAPEQASADDAFAVLDLHDYINHFAAVETQPLSPLGDALWEHAYQLTHGAADAPSGMATLGAATNEILSTIAAASADPTAHPAADHAHWVAAHAASFA